MSYDELVETWLKEATKEIIDNDFKPQLKLLTDALELALKKEKKLKEMVDNYGKELQQFKKRHQSHKMICFVKNVSTQTTLKVGDGEIVYVRAKRPSQPLQPPLALSHDQTRLMPPPLPPPLKSAPPANFERTSRGPKKNVLNVIRKEKHEEVELIEIDSD